MVQSTTNIAIKSKQQKILTRAKLKEVSHLSPRKIPFQQIESVIDKNKRAEIEAYRIEEEERQMQEEIMRRISINQ